MQRRTFITSIAAGSAPAIPATTLAQDASPPAAEAWPTAPGLVDSGYAPVNGLEIYYGILGSDRGNTPLLIMHGAYMNVDAMLQIIFSPLATVSAVVKPWAASGAAALLEPNGDELGRGSQSFTPTPDQPHSRRTA